MTVKEFIKENPNASIDEIVLATGAKRRSVIEIKSKLKKLELLEYQQPGLVKECEAAGVDATTVTHGWYKGKSWSIFFKDGSEREATYESLTDLITERMSAHVPNYAPVNIIPVRDPHLFVYDPADIHINKLATAYETGEDYNSQIAVQRCREGLQGLLNKSFGFKFDQILFIVGNDALNADGPQNSTTKGTRQDTHLLWTEAFLMAYGIFVEQIETLGKIAPVVVKFNPSNHDVMAGWYLAQTLKTHFRLHDNVSFDCSTAHRKYHRYGKNLIGSTHGDGAKPDKLPMLMAYEAKKDWSDCKHYYFYTHHVHHKNSKDYGEVCVESLRSPSSADGWHDRNGFIGAPKAIEAFIHNPEHGQCARLTHIF